jgi:hypothetical protein
LELSEEIQLEGSAADWFLSEMEALIELAFLPVSLAAWSPEVALVCAGLEPSEEIQLEGPAAGWFPSEVQALLFASPAAGSPVEALFCAGLPPREESHFACSFPAVECFLIAMETLNEALSAVASFPKAVWGSGGS